MSQEQEEQETCSICYESITLKNVVVTECGHKFHFGCINKHIMTCSSGEKCPICRTPFSIDYESECETESDSIDREDDEEIRTTPFLIKIENHDDLLAYLDYYDLRELYQALSYFMFKQIVREVSPDFERLESYEILTNATEIMLRTDKIKTTETRKLTGIIPRGVKESHEKYKFNVMMAEYLQDNTKYK